jgi:hypothetical protein
MPMSYILHDFLVPYLGEEAATYWATLLVIYPL